MEPYGPLTRLSSEVDWQYRRAVVLPRVARDATLLRERDLQVAAASIGTPVTHQRYPGAALRAGLAFATRLARRRRLYPAE